jgi:acetyltransferase
MSISSKRRFDPALFFHPASVSLSGAETPLGQTVLTHLRAGNFAGRISLDDEAENVDLAIIADAPGQVGAALKRHAARGARGALVLSDVPELDRLAREAGIRVLGPYSYGMVLPGLGLNASVFSLTPPRGRLALIGQSPALARTIIDWAVPNSVGFSHIVGIGGNSDIGFGRVLDHLSRDPGTAAILLEIDRLRDPKLFHSAARAAARLRPVVAIAPGVRLRDRQGNSRNTLEAAFSRAGVLLTSSIGELLAAAETLTRVKPARGESLAIIGNSFAASRLAADFALDSGISLAQFSPETQQVLAMSMGEPPPPSGLLHCGDVPTRLADLAALLSSAPEVGGILVVHTPSGGDDSVAIEALIACAKTVTAPLLIAALGEANGLAHRHKLAAAGLACFDSPEAAISGFRHLLRNRENRAAARELPSSAVLRMPPDQAAAKALVDRAYATGQEALVQGEALAVLAAYHIPVLPSRLVTTPADATTAARELGFPVVLKAVHPSMPVNRLAGSIALDLSDASAVHRTVTEMRTRLAAQSPALASAAILVQPQANGRPLRIRVSDHAILGPVIGFGAGAGDPEDVSGLAAELPPLNLVLARALIARSAIAASLAAHRGSPAADLEAVAATIVRVSQLIIDRPEILSLELDPVFAHARGVVAASARITLRPRGAQRPPLLISPYPSELIGHHTARGQNFLLRPIRPEDADAHAAMLGRFTVEDLRYRFFSAIRNMPAEQINRLTDIDYAREMAIIAVRESTGETAGTARLVRSDTDGTQAEFAVAVEPAAKGLGLGTALMRAVLDWGRAQGVVDVSGQILADNAPMLAFAKHLGFTIAHIPGEADLVEARLTLG